MNKSALAIAGSILLALFAVGLVIIALQMIARAAGLCHQ